MSILNIPLPKSKTRPRMKNSLVNGAINHLGPVLWSGWARRSLRAGNVPPTTTLFADSCTFDKHEQLAPLQISFSSPTDGILDTENETVPWEEAPGGSLGWCVGLWTGSSSPKEWCANTLLSPTPPCPCSDIAVTSPFLSDGKKNKHYSG